ncbi:MAG: hypothetical protein CUN56_13200 [Phototrophicales bacterium]|nr:MAG: hypothetical protein CUN56_13200 [Phototrophicales bacterium]
MYFNIVDAGGRVFEGAEVETVNIQLDDGSQYVANVIQPENPFYIAIVLDASGSMTSANPAMRAAAIAAVDDAPELAQFAVLSFSERENINLIQGFSPDPEQTKVSIDSVRSIENGGTCLYDATMRALELVASQPQGRRAVILFTDGVDETARGEPCSVNTLENIIEVASNPGLQIPIYVVGMRGRGGTQINEGELRLIADSTGGLAAFGDSSQLNTMFDIMMTALNNQWLAQAEIYPPAGVRRAIITPVFESGVNAFATTIEFVVSRNFIPPLEIFFGSITYDETRDITSVEIIANGADRASQLRVEIIDTERNLTVSSFNVPGVPEKIEIPGDGLEPDGEYAVSITGLNDGGQPVSQPFVNAFVYRGLGEQPIQVNIIRVELSEDESMLEVTLATQGRDRISGLFVSIVDEQTNTAVGDPLQTSSAPTAVNVPLTNLQPGKEYRVEITPIDLTGQLITDAITQRQFVTSPPLLPTVILDGVNHTPGTTEVSIDLLITNPQLIGSMRVSGTSKQGGTRVFDPIIIDGAQSSINIPTDRMSKDQEYIITINILDDDGNPLAQPIIAEFLYSPPGKSIFERIGEFVASPIVLGVLVAIALFLVFWFYNQRKQKQAQPAEGNLNYIKFSKTQLAQLENNMGSGRRMINNPADSNKTRIEQRPPTGAPPMPQRNNPTVQRQPPAQLEILQANTQMPQRMVQITTPRFIIGREGRDLNFDNDPSVSRQHLEISFSSAHGAYQIKDLGSTFGTKVNGRPLMPDHPEILSSTQVITIELGKSAVVRFRVLHTQPGQDLSSNWEV